MKQKNIIKWLLIGLMYTGFNTVHAHRYFFFNKTGKTINVQGSACACLAANHDFNFSIPDGTGHAFDSSYCCVAGFNIDGEWQDIGMTCDDQNYMISLATQADYDNRYSNIQSGHKYKVGNR
jgi:hypothetical protein